MATPVGHSLLGYVLYLTSYKDYRLFKNWKIIALYVFAANAPDLDFIPGIFIGNANRFHHGISHTLGFSLLFALIMYMIPRFRTRKDFAIFFSLYFGHVVIDFFTADTSAPFGIMLFWPFTKRYFISSYSLFSDIHHLTLSDLFDLHNVKAIVWEAVVFFSMIVLLVLTREIRKRSFSGHRSKKQNR